MQRSMFRKGLVLAIVVLFVGVSVTITTGKINKNRVLEDTTVYNILNYKEDDWWDEDWEYRKQITINHSMVTADLQNFPVLISIISSDFIDHAQFDGDDFVFVLDDNSNTFSHEIEYYKSSSGKLVAWVNITSLSSNVDTILYLYYSNPNCSSQQDPDNVWDSDYIHVWHLGESLKDSAGSDDGNDHGTSKVSGKIGQARDFEQSEHDYIDFGDMMQPTDGSLTTMTWEAWIKPETEDIPLMTKYNTQGSTKYGSYGIHLGYDGKFYNYAIQASGKYTQSITINDYSVVGQWVYLTSTWTLGGVNDIDPFINGSEVSDIQSSSNGNYMQNTPITDDLGRYNPEAGTKYTDAVIDEVRWSKIVRSGAWINTSYNTMNDSSSFFSVGPEEIENYPPSTPICVFPLNGSTDVPIDINLSWTCSDPEGDNLTFDVYFGNSIPLPKIVGNQSYTSYNLSLLEYCTTYYWQIVAWDEHGASTSGDIWEFTTICNGPPGIPRINGPTSGKSGTTYSYTFVSEDPNGDDVFYEIDWGDGQVDPWDGPHDSNTVITRDHSWDDQGTFKISARAKDVFDFVGDWGELDVEIPRNKIFTNSFLLKLFARFQNDFPIIKFMLRYIIVS